jgi:lysophospholipase L1-like esterase
MKIKVIMQNFLLFSVAIIFVVAAIEIGVRLTKVELHPPGLFAAQREGVPYKLRAGFHGSTSTGIPLDINSMGMRDKEYPLEREENTFRIVVLGDSVTFGQAVRQEDTYPEQLEGMLDNVEVINAGVSGYGTNEELLFLKETAIQYKPDMIIVGYGLNDLGKIKPALRGEDIMSRLLFEVKEFVKYNFWSYGYLTVALQSAVYNIRVRDKSVGINKADFTSENPGWNITYESMLEIKETAADNNATLVVLILPDLRFINRTEENYGYGEIHDEVGEKFSQFAYVLDLLPAFEGYTRGQVTVNEKDAHPNKKGHELIAKATYEFLDEEGLIAK